MRCIDVHNVNQGLAEGLRHLQHFGLEQESRNGKVLVSPWPVVTTYQNPAKRVLFSPLRDANPYFHFMEGLWMLAGRNDLDWPKKFNKRFAEYSDDGHTLHGAYGYRWRQHFKLDQVFQVIEEMQRTPGTRRAVMSMWDAPAEWAALGAEQARDIPCNTHLYFDTIDSRLNMTVCCRSNDIWWGAYGANAVHFSMLQEYVAAALEVPMGVYRQFSNNYHVYPDNLPAKNLEDLSDDARTKDLYTASVAHNSEGDRHYFKRKCLGDDGPETLPLIKHDVGSFERNLAAFFENPHESLYSEPIFSQVAAPMLLSWEAYKNKDYSVADMEAATIEAADWRIACLEWLQRKRAKREMKMRQGIG